MNPTQMKAVELAQGFKMPWGKFKGIALDDIPSSYLRWLATECDNDIIASHADTVWNWRKEMDIL